MKVNSLVLFGDLHAGCQLALIPPRGIQQTHGPKVTPSPFQKKLWRMWREFWDEWVPQATRGDEFAVVNLGDTLDGRHHNATSQWSHDLADQANCAARLLEPIVELCGGRYYHLRGTEAHGGPQGEQEEMLADRLGAVPAEGLSARFELWKYVGASADILVHCLHHIGTTGAAAYETTAVHKEFIDAVTEAGRWGHRPPDVIVRAHRHRYIKTEVATENERGVSMVLPGWQGKTPFLYRIAGARLSQPQFGGAMIRLSEEGEPYIRQRVWSLQRPRPE